MACLNQSLTSALDIFYQDLPVVSISAKTGLGFDNLISAINSAAKDYEDNYRPEMERISRESQLANLNERTSDLTLDDDNVPERDESLTNSKADDLITFGPKKSTDF